MYDLATTMLEGTFFLTALVGLAIAGFWWVAPRCPECGFLVSVRDAVDPSLRHCRRCLSVFRKEQR
jgi:hypothetical protein